jgi:hypothetical protein
VGGEFQREVLQVLEAVRGQLKPDRQARALIEPGREGLRMPPLEFLRFARMAFQIDHDETLPPDGHELMLVARADEHQRSRLERLPLAVDVVMARTRLKPEDFRVIVRVQRERRTALAGDPDQMPEFPRRRPPMETKHSVDIKGRYKNVKAGDEKAA